jgi:hypothetical protein
MVAAPRVRRVSPLEYPVGKALYEFPAWLRHPRISPRGDRIAFVEHPPSMIVMARLS